MYTNLHNDAPTFGGMPFQKKRLELTVTVTSKSIPAPHCFVNKVSVNVTILIVTFIYNVVLKHVGVKYLANRGAVVHHEACWDLPFGCLLKQQ